MDKKEFDNWKSVMESSKYHWVEDAVTRLNGKGTLYYKGGESGVYMKTAPDGNFQVGTYEAAVPHIGDAFFTMKAEKKCHNENEAFQMACHVGGVGFLTDMFSNEKILQEAGVFIQPGPML